MTACNAVGDPSTASGSSLGASSAVNSAQSSPANARSSGPTDLSAQAALPDAVLKLVCSGSDVDAQSEVYIAVHKGGEAHRIEVTHSRSIPDLGNLVFDMQGKQLGNTTGMEFPHEDKKLHAEEVLRVAKMLDGASIPKSQKPLSCGPVRR